MDGIVDSISSVCVIILGFHFEILSPVRLTVLSSTYFYSQRPTEAEQPHLVDWLIACGVNYFWHGGTQDKSSPVNSIPQSVTDWPLCMSISYDLYAMSSSRDWCVPLRIHTNKINKNKKTTSLSVHLELFYLKKRHRDRPWDRVLDGLGLAARIRWCLDFSVIGPRSDS